MKKALLLIGLLLTASLSTSAQQDQFTEVYHGDWKYMEIFNDFSSGINLIAGTRALSGGGYLSVGCMNEKLYAKVSVGRTIDKSWSKNLHWIDWIVDGKKGDGSVWDPADEGKAISKTGEFLYVFYLDLMGGKKLDVEVEGLNQRIHKASFSLNGYDKAVDNVLNHCDARRE